MSDPLAGLMDEGAEEDSPFQAQDSLTVDGGKGSGNFGHAGRISRVGGSSKGIKATLMKGDGTGNTEEAFGFKKDKLKSYFRDHGKITGFKDAKAYQKND